jgi:hypothetical protein
LRGSYKFKQRVVARLQAKLTKFTSCRPVRLSVSRPTVSLGL